uniref:Mitochondrial import inner membrane translocase subunit n=1 Tax=Chaetoceros debilis TaxID=122233 RepID=A0A7S3V4K5_9STRA|mmetsp:Transcript_3734/g.5583  ORF Transcript_3734/g.5583 Transcript_3734/m.5583 type:complete len:122 (+) Transcript_3734:95-460(+)|eukprot:CAMPEP_0194082352 /NCGR_PEP_ID=MMETSP0149-20130528/7886_1 /TAXON_ID=122233 /ORGANISM="Chaetoceros debilis, Strain MM31A-1" /LENGTH=121 /DNA_ID=CAMNT_0038764489 /DNA_START=87 /DNA_END=452 /DNA_ORIENTATION=-
MGFFSRGSSDDSSQPATRDFSSSDEAAYTHEDTMPTSPSAAGMAEMQQFAAAIQQQVLVQATISDLTEKAFERCITKPSDSLTGYEASCVQAVTNKWLDSNQFIMKRFQKKMASQQSEPTY